jgi:hypothetical protein
MKLDPYNSKLKYENWKEKGSIIEGVSKVNEKIINKFLLDMEQGININTSNKKGSRSYIRLNAYRSKLKTLAGFFKKDFPTITKQDFHKLIKDMSEGKIKRQDGQTYKDITDYVKTFKAFWHWLQKTSKKRLDDICEEIGTTKNKPQWVYLDMEQFKRLAENCKPYFKVLAYFMLDTGQRVTEFKNCKVSSFTDDFKFYEVTDEVSKTFGRKIKLMMTSDLIRDYVKENKLKDDDFLFPVSPSETNQYYKRVSKRLFGDTKSKAGQKYSNLSLADFRHISATYWLPRYPTEQGMMYRFGWKKSDKIYYYSEFLGMKDNIREENLLLDITKTDLQQQNETLKKNIELQQESLREIQKDLIIQQGQIQSLIHKKQEDIEERYSNDSLK